MKASPSSSRISVTRPLIERRRHGSAGSTTETAMFGRWRKARLLYDSVGEPSASVRDTCASTFVRSR
jgi:hypothetical protein